MKLQTQTGWMAALAVSVLLGGAIAWARADDASPEGAPALADDVSPAGDAALADDVSLESDAALAEDVSPEGDAALADGALAGEDAALADGVVVGALADGAGAERLAPALSCHAVCAGQFFSSKPLERSEDASSTR